MNGHDLGLQHVLGMQRGYQTAVRLYQPNGDPTIHLNRYLPCQRPEQRAGYVSGYCAGWLAGAVTAQSRDGMLEPLDWRREVNEAESDAP